MMYRKRFPRNYRAHATQDYDTGEQLRGPREAAADSSPRERGWMPWRLGHPTLTSLANPPYGCVRAITIENADSACQTPFFCGNRRSSERSPSWNNH
jgi:hypothetical protein